MVKEVNIYGADFHAWGSIKIHDTGDWSLVEGSFGADRAESCTESDQDLIDGLLDRLNEDLMNERPGDFYQRIFDDGDFYSDDF